MNFLFDKDFWKGVKESVVAYVFGVLFMGAVFLFSIIMLLHIYEVVIDFFTS
jgi:hypothetical protein